jgi:hypothetical protein
MGMSAIYNENAAHRAAILAAESTRQSAVSVATTQSAIRTAEIAYARSCLKSALANNCDASNWTMLLLSLGVET